MGHRDQQSGTRNLGEFGDEDGEKACVESSETELTWANRYPYIVLLGNRQ